MAVRQNRNRPRREPDDLCCRIERRERTPVPRPAFSTHWCLPLVPRQSIQRSALHSLFKVLDKTLTGVVPAKNRPGAPCFVSPSRLHLCSLELFKAGRSGPPPCLVSMCSIGKSPAPGSCRRWLWGISHLNAWRNWLLRPTVSLLGRHSWPLAR